MLHNYRIKLTSHNPESIKEVDNYFKELHIKNKRFVFLPKDKKIFTLIKSPHVNNKSKEQFKIEKFKRLVCLTISFQELKTMLKRLPSDLLIKISVSD
jgi:small subunit ribosomal protein S10